MTSIAFRRARHVLAATAALGMVAGCSTVGSFLDGDKVDYKSATVRTSGLEVPPDLTQLSRDTRYQQSNGSVSASTFQNPAAAGVAAVAVNPAIAPTQVGEFRMEREGSVRWLSTTLPPETIYPQVRAFWKDNGFNLVQDRAEAGVLETDWAENRAKLPNDIIRNTIGKVFDSALSTGELDKFRTRIERTAKGTDIYISHRGLEEVYIGERKESTTWRPRAAEPLLEAEFLSRLMVKLGAKDEAARAVVAGSGKPGAPAGPVRARNLDGKPTPTLQVDDSFDRAWRRVGIALDRSGFTVEDRDRAQGLYFVRYVDPATAGRGEPNIFSRIFSFGKKEESGLAKYRIKVTGEGTSSTVAVLDSQGNPQSGENTKRIASLLLDDLK